MNKILILIILLLSLFYFLNFSEKFENSQCDIHDILTKDIDSLDYSTLYKEIIVGSEKCPGLRYLEDDPMWETCYDIKIDDRIKNDTFSEYDASNYSELKQIVKEQITSIKNAMNIDNSQDGKIVCIGIDKNRVKTSKDVTNIVNVLNSGCPDDQICPIEIKSTIPTTAAPTTAAPTTAAPTTAAPTTAAPTTASPTTAAPTTAAPTTAAPTTASPTTAAPTTASPTTAAPTTAAPTTAAPTIPDWMVLLKSLVD
jgi:hypothetical protein